MYLSDCCNSGNYIKIINNDLIYCLKCYKQCFIYDSKKHINQKVNIVVNGKIVGEVSMLNLKRLKKPCI